jgi:hypothetical protein
VSGVCCLLVKLGSRGRTGGYKHCCSCTVFTCECACSKAACRADTSPVACPARQVSSAHGTHRCAHGHWPVRALPTTFTQRPHLTDPADKEAWLNTAMCPGRQETTNSTNERQAQELRGWLMSRGWTSGSLLKSSTSGGEPPGWGRSG